MPLYNVDVTIEFSMVVQADDEDHAWDVANDNWEEAMSDDPPQPDLHVVREITAIGKLPLRWDGMCLPYGGDGNARLGKLLGETAQEQSE